MPLGRLLALCLLSAAAGTGFGEAAWALSVQEHAFAFPEWSRAEFWAAGALFGAAYCLAQALSWSFAFDLWILSGGRLGFLGSLLGLGGWLWSLALRVPIPAPHNLPSRKLQIFLAALLILGMALSLGSGLWTLYRKRGLIEGMAPRSLALRLWGTAFVAYLLTGMWTAGWHMTGDAPHYLLIAHSLAYDGDLDLANQYKHRDWLRYRERELPPQEKPLADGRHYSEHKPLHPLLLAPGYRLLGLRGALWTQALLASAATALFFLLLLQLGYATRQAFLGWALLAFSAPWWIHSQSLMSEMLNGVLFLTAFASLSGLLPWLAAPLVAGLLPWMGVRLYPVALCLALWISWKAWRQGFKARALAAPLLLALSLGLGLWLNASHLGSASPLAAYHKATLDQAGNADGFKYGFFELFRPLLAPRILPAYFLDQGYGWLGYVPFDFLLFFGLLLWWRDRRGALKDMAAIALPYLALMGSFWWWWSAMAPNRYMLCLAPFFVLLAFEAAERLRWKGAAFWLAAMNFAWALLTAVLPWLCYPKEEDGKNWILKIASGLLGRDLTGFFPRFMIKTPFPLSHWIPTIAWILGLIAFTVWYWRRHKGEWEPRKSPASPGRRRALLNRAP